MSLQSSICLHKLWLFRLFEIEIYLFVLNQFIYGCFYEKKVWIIKEKWTESSVISHLWRWSWGVPWSLSGQEKKHSLPPVMADTRQRMCFWGTSDYNAKQNNNSKKKKKSSGVFFNGVASEGRESLPPSQQAPGLSVIGHLPIQTTNLHLQCCLLL